MSTPELIRIVSRASPMALAQVERVRAELASLHPGIRTEVVPVTTSGDRWMGSLSALGGKGAFTKEVDAALLAGEADLAVHCMKDVPADRPLPAGTLFAARFGAGRPLGAAGMLALDASFGNTVMMGIPLVTAAFGAEALAVLLAAGWAVQAEASCPVIPPTAPAMTARSRSSSAAATKWRMAVRSCR